MHATGWDSPASRNLRHPNVPNFSSCPVLIVSKYQVRISDKLVSLLIDCFLSSARIQGPYISIGHGRHPTSPHVFTIYDHLPPQSTLHNRSYDTETLRHYELQGLEL